MPLGREDETRRDLETSPRTEGGSDAFLREVARISAPPPPHLPSDGSDLIGQSLGHFTVLAELGRGGMGVVYLARDETLRRDVALKVLLDAHADHPERRRRFLREARSAGAVAHPGIASVFEVGESAGRVFIAMELVEGRTLRAMLDGGRLPLAETLSIARQILDGLSRAHQRGIVHRDLKPDNVMVDAQGRVKILDFGLAKAFGNDGPTPADRGAVARPESVITAQGQILGTPAYMSPEQGRGAALDARSDLFSLGVVLYEMLSGRRPFRGTNVELLMAISADDPEPLAAHRASVPPELEAIVLRCLRKVPADRYPTAEAVLADLERLAPSDLNAAARQTTSPEHLGVTEDLRGLARAEQPSSTSRRRPMWVRAVLGAMAIAIVAIGVLATTHAIHAPSCSTSVPDGAM